jgi:hypothetical protein
LAGVENWLEGTIRACAPVDSGAPVVAPGGGDQRRKTPRALRGA